VSIGLLQIGVRTTGVVNQGRIIRGLQAGATESFQDGEQLSDHSALAIEQLVHRPSWAAPFFKSVL